MRNRDDGGADTDVPNRHGDEERPGVIAWALVAAGGVAGIIGITNPRRAVEAQRCSGGQLYGVPEPAVELARDHTTTTAKPIRQEA